MAGVYPNFPPTIEQADPGAWSPGPRLERLDEYGVYGQVLYPNLLGFHTHAFLSTGDDELMLKCVEAYNDFLIDFTSEDSARFIPIMVLPFWDVEKSVAEIKRCYAKGHKGIAFGSEFEKIGYPGLASGHWDPIFDVAQTLELSINFHVGFSAFTAGDFDKLSKKEAGFSRLPWTQTCVLMFLGNAKAISDVIFTGVGNRFPRLNFVSVESGFGYVPYLVESMDWMWKNGGAFRENPDLPLPSEIFRRQVYATFWFEKTTLKNLVDYADNVMFETDYPHPTSLSPGPASYADIPRNIATENLQDFPDDVVRKVLHENAARIYHMD